MEKPNRARFDSPHSRRIVDHLSRRFHRQLVPQKPSVDAPQAVDARQAERWLLRVRPRPLNWTSSAMRTPILRKLYLNSLMQWRHSEDIRAFMSLYRQPRAAKQHTDSDEGNKPGSTSPGFRGGAGRADGVRRTEVRVQHAPPYPTASASLSRSSRRVIAARYAGR